MEEIKVNYLIALFVILFVIGLILGFLISPIFDSPTIEFDQYDKAIEDLYIENPGEMFEPVYYNTGKLIGFVVYHPNYDYKEFIHINETAYVAYT